MVASLPAAWSTVSASCTHCWYSGLSGASSAIFRGLFWRSPPAYLAGFLATRLFTQSPLLSARIEQSVKSLHA